MNLQPAADATLQAQWEGAMRGLDQGSVTVLELVDMAGRWAGSGAQELARQAYLRWLQSEAARHDPLAYVAHFNLGVLLVDSGDAQAAQTQYRQALHLQPGLAVAYTALSELLETQGETHAAHALWRDAMQWAAATQPAQEDLLSIAQGHLRRITQTMGPDPGPKDESGKPAAATARRHRLEAFDALEAGVIFVLWLGPALMSPSRTRALQSIFRDSARPVCFITDASLHEWVRPDWPLHPAYRCLSEVHRADYLRCYLMHHYGGGYTDIKPALRSWTSHFAQMQGSEQLALGYPEISANAVAQLPGPLGEQLRAHFAEVIGYCSMIFRRQSALTTEWMDATHAKLDAVLRELQSHPAQAPMDQRGIVLPDGSASQYPLAWTELGGNIFHPLMLKYRDRVIKEPGIVPQLYDYR